MRIAIMQPYFLPYFGYFQLINAVDRFVILDDVNYIKQGWVNRNRIPASRQNPDRDFQWLTVPVKNASQNRLIHDMEITDEDRWKRSMWYAIQNFYGRAQYFPAIRTQIDRWLTNASGNLSTFLTMTICEVARLCGISTQLIPTSSIYPKRGLRGTERILDICRQEKAHTYINLPGGRGLYSEDEFRSAGIELSFLEPSWPALAQRSGHGNHVFSILDQLMLNPPETMQEMMRVKEVRREKADIAPAA